MKKKITESDQMTNCIAEMLLYLLNNIPKEKTERGIELIFDMAEKHKQIVKKCINHAISRGFNEGYKLGYGLALKETWEIEDEGECVRVGERNWIK